MGTSEWSALTKGIQILTISECSSGSAELGRPGQVFVLNVVTLDFNNVKKMAFSSFYYVFQTEIYFLLELNKSISYISFAHLKGLI